MVWQRQDGQGVGRAAFGRSVSSNKSLLIIYLPCLTLARTAAHLCTFSTRTQLLQYCTRRDGTDSLAACQCSLWFPSKPTGRISLVVPLEDEDFECLLIVEGSTTTRSKGRSEGRKRGSYMPRPCVLCPPYLSRSIDELPGTIRRLSSRENIPHRLLSIHTFLSGPTFAPPQAQLIRCDKSTSVESIIPKMRYIKGRDVYPLWGNGT